MSDILDLTELLAARALKPRKATFAGVDLEIRRDLSAAEVIEFFDLLKRGSFIEALAMLVGTETAQTLGARIDVLPREHQNTIYGRIMREAGTLPRLGVVDETEVQEDPPGESSAS